MKKNLFNAALILLLSFGNFTAFAQTEEEQTYKAPTPKWVPAKGYWVIESNVKKPKTATLYFYNNDNQLLYKEKMEGVKLNVKKRKTKIRLKKILDESLVLYEQRKKAGENEMLAKNILTGK